MSPISRHLLALAVVGVASSHAAPAAANCFGPDPTIVATLPADGATDVPLDTNIVIFSAATPESLTLNGEALTREGFVWKVEGELAPETTYEVVMGLLEPNPPTPVEERFTFTTGTSLAATDEVVAPEVVAHVVGEEVEGLPPECMTLALQAGCPDTDDPSLVRLSMASTTAGWIVEMDEGREFDLAWPASCSERPLWAGYLETRSCFSVRAIDEAGRLSEATSYCLGEAPGGDAGGGDGAEGQAPDSGSGAVSSGGAAVGGEGCASASVGSRVRLWPILALLGVALGHRRRRRRG